MFSKANLGAVRRFLAVVLAVAALSCAMAFSVFADDASSASSTGGLGSYTMIIYFVVIIGVFYFLMIRPEKKKRKQAEELRKSIGVGDEITTIGGMVGKVVSVNDNFLVFETGEDRVRIQIAKWAISTTGKASADPEQK